jgi:hypothetical protein
MAMSCWNAWRFIAVTVRGRRVRRSTKQCCRDVERRESAVALRYLSHWLRRIGSAGTRGPGRGVGGTRRGLRHEKRCKEGGRGKGTKRQGRVVGKEAGGRVRLYLVKDRAGRSIPEAARAVRAVTGPLDRMA